MNKLLITIFVFALCSAKAQTTIPNLDFELWTTSASGRFDEPNPSTIWATPNYAMDLVFGTPTTSPVQKSTDKHGGNFAALMKSRSILGQFLGATLFTGKLITTSPTNPVPVLGVPFTGRPSAMKGWYKYTSVNGDSSSIYIKLTRWNTSTNSRETVGFYEEKRFASITNYTEFNFPIAYSSAATADSITIVFSASAGADQRRGQVGSSLFIDDVVLEYTTGFLQPLFFENLVTIFPNPTHDFLQFKTTENIASARIYDVNMQLLHDIKILNNNQLISVRHLPSKNYIIQFFDKQNTIKGIQNFIKK